MDIRKHLEELEKTHPKETKRAKNALALQIGNEVERNRVASNLTQKALAKKVHTKQSGISRLERGTSLPSLRFLKKIANAMEMYVECKFYPFVSAVIASQVDSPDTETASITQKPSNSNQWYFAYNFSSQASSARAFATTR